MHLNGGPIDPHLLAATFVLKAGSLAKIFN